ncbi:unnamed protein product [Phaedon cochleariae]|uniref:phospholipase D n=1 Tax=Phaedon cochleariae TaxID=80249 RepID=A0A9N9SK15_PHACE|nr:unnamed protein product [Phaedon cochleariae]
MSAVADAIENAKEEVFITDWWLSPEIYLKRPAIVGDHWQLKKLLERKAKSGVKIYILLYKEVEMALGLNSYYSKQKLIEASSNIQVMRHPDHAKAGVLLWAHHEKMVVVDQTYAFVGGIDLCYGRWDDDKHSITPMKNTANMKRKTSSSPMGEAIYPIPIPYCKLTPIPEIKDSLQPHENGNTRLLPQLEPGDNLLMPRKRSAKVKVNTPEIDRKHHILEAIKDKGKELIHLVYNPHEDDEDDSPVLRSVSCWSCGFFESDTVEQSIHEAYIDAITKAQHYIYIENQFFITLSYNNPNTRNQIGESLYKRILRAYKGKDALLIRLKEAGIEDPSEYITFYGLRTHSKLNQEPITELIYVHSKLMIVDDKLVICGSANINDRSMIGKRDSEVAVLIEDESFDDGVMNNKAFPCGKFAGSLRKYLFREHLGILDNDTDVFDMDITDPVANHFYKDVWYKTASLNTEFYEKVFHCLPTDSVRSFSDLKKIHEEKPLILMKSGRNLSSKRRHSNLEEERMHVSTKTN